MINAILFRKTFEAVGGFSDDLPLMEDVDIVRRLRAFGRIVMAEGRMLTSARRWEENGVWANSLGNVSRLYRYFRGASPQMLAKDYPDIR